MDLVSTIKFVNAAVDNKTAVQDMKHFMIEHGYIRATNGVLSLGSPIDINLDCAPHAATFLKAIQKCNEVASVGLTGAGRLRVSSGKFKAFVPCIEPNGGPYHPKPSGTPVEVDGQMLLDAFKRLEPFVYADNIRPWANGILLRGQSAYATNNIILVEAWLGSELPFVANIPLPAIKEVIKQDTPHSKLMMDNHSITFLYESGRWIKTQLYETEWPPIERILNVECQPRPIPEDFFTALAAVGKFAEDGRVYFRKGSVHTSMSDQDGAQYEVEGLPEHGLYKSEMLQLLENVATSADFDRYPENAIFYGDNIRGVVMGLRE